MGYTAVYKWLITHLKKNVLYTVYPRYAHIIYIVIIVIYIYIHTACLGSNLSHFLVHQAGHLPIALRAPTSVGSARLYATLPAPDGAKSDENLRRKWEFDGGSMIINGGYDGGYDGG